MTLSSNWDDPAEMLSRAQNARAAGDQEVAYQMFARASELNPQDAQAWQGRAETAVSSDEALVSYAYAAALKPDDSPLTRTLDASIARRIQSSTTSDVPLLLALGQELAEVGLTERAHQVFTRASELEPASTDALVWLAGTAADEQQQLDLLNRALETNPRDPRARAGLLTAKLPAPPPAALVAAESESPPVATESATPTPSPAPAPTAQTETEAMERLRTLRANATPPESKATAVSSAETLTAPAPATKSPMQWILIGLLVLVALLLVAGLFLTFGQ